MIEDNRSGETDPLLLPPTHLLWLPVLLTSKLNQIKRLSDLFLNLLFVNLSHFQRKCDVFKNRHMGE